MHFALPVPVVGPAELELLDAALGVDPAWRRVGDAEPGDPVLGARWEHVPDGAELALTVLGFAPSLATLSASASASATRSALQRAVEAVPEAGGLLIGDAELGWWIEAVRERWAWFVDAQRRIEELSVWLEFVQCGRCGELTHREAPPRCRVCGHRFADAERAQHEARRGQAGQAVAAARMELDGLGCGEGLVPGWPYRSEPVDAAMQEGAW